MSRRTARRSFAYVAIASSIVAACNLISGLDKDFELAGGASYPDVLGGEEGSVDSSSPGRDGARNDGGALPDWCEERFDELSPSLGDAGHFFCDTFERTEGNDTAPPFGWMNYHLADPDGDGLKIVPDAGVDASSALQSHLVTSGTEPSEGWVSVLWKDLCRLDRSGKSLTLSFRFNVVDSTLEYAVLGAIQARGGGEYGIAIYKGNASCSIAGSTSICLDENDPGSGHNFESAVQLTKGKWYLATIKVTRTEANFQGKIELDAEDAEGTTKILHNAPPLGTIQDAAPANPFDVGVGTFFASSNGSATVLIDDVVAWCEETSD